MSSQHSLEDDALRAKLEFGVWRDGFDHAFAEWCLASGELKSALLLSGQALVDAESWLLSHDASFTQLERQFIYKSLSSASARQAQSRLNGAQEQRELQRHRVRLIVSMFVVTLSIMAPGLFNLLIHDMMAKTQPPSTVASTGGADAKAPPLAKSPVQAQPKPQPSRESERARGELMRQEAQLREDTIAEARRQNLASVALRLASGGNRNKALAVAIEAVESVRAAKAAGKEVRSQAEAEAALFQALATPIALPARRPFASTASVGRFCGGTRLAAAAVDDKLVAVWDAASGKERVAIDGRTEQLQALAFDAGCGRLALAEGEHAATIWSLADGRRLVDLVGHESDIVATAFSPDGRRIATAAQDGSARLWDAASGRVTARLNGHDDGLRSIAFSPDGSRLITASEDKTARVWDAASGREELVLDGHQGFVTSGAFSADGSRLLTSSNDGSAALWNAANGDRIATLRPAAGGVMSATFSRDGRFVGSVDWGSGAHIWDGRTGTLMGHVPTEPEPTRGIEFSADGRFAAIYTRNGPVRLWATDGMKEIARLAVPDERLQAVSFKADGSSIAVFTETGRLVTWPLVASLEDALAHARQQATRCLDDAERKALGIGPGKPEGCTVTDAR